MFKLVDLNFFKCDLESTKPVEKCCHETERIIHQNHASKIKQSLQNIQSDTIRWKFDRSNKQRVVCKDVLRLYSIVEKYPHERHELTVRPSTSRFHHQNQGTLIYNIYKKSISIKKTKIFYFLFLDLYQNRLNNTYDI